MTLSELWDELNSHDWYYAMSDDSRKWISGHKNINRLSQLARNIEGGDDLLGAFSAHAFSGEPFGTERKPKPDRPEE